MGNEKKRPPATPQSSKDWFIRGLDMVAMPFTDPDRAWRGFKKDILNMKGGFVILLLLVACFVMHWWDSLTPSSGGSGTVIFPVENSGNALNLQNSPNANVTQNVNRPPAPSIVSADPVFVNEPDTFQGIPVYKTQFHIQIGNPGEANNFPISYHIPTPYLVGTPDAVQDGNVELLTANGPIFCKSYRFTFRTKDKVDESQVTFLLAQPNNK